MAGGLRAAMGSILDLFYPPGCLACGRSVECADIVLCASCLKVLTRLPEKGCARCGSPLVNGQNSCSTCVRQSPALELVRSVAWFIGPVPALIHRFKYQGLHRLSAFFAELMDSFSAGCEVVEPAEVLVPVPLHRWRKLRRGYNQSEKLSEALAELSGKELVSDALIRVRRTRSQTRLTLEERKLNVAGAFKVKNPRRIHGRIVLLVDDVMTTGATLDACALTLKKAGAKKVLAYTFARA